MIWFSSAFPLVLFPDPGLTDTFAVGRDYLKEVRKTDAMLAAAQVAMYPVAAEGLAGDSVYDAGNQPVGVTSAQQAERRSASSFRTTQSSAMPTIQPWRKSRETPEAPPMSTPMD